MDVVEQKTKERNELHMRSDKIYFISCNTTNVFISWNGVGSGNIRPILFRKEFPTEKEAHLSAMDLEHRISKCLPGKLIPLLENWSNDLCVYDSASIRCPNCGAPIEDGKCCVYCGQII